MHRFATHTSLTGLLLSFALYGCGASNTSSAHVPQETASGSESAAPEATAAPTPEATAAPAPEAPDALAGVPADFRLTRRESCVECVSEDTQRRLEMNQSTGHFELRDGAASQGLAVPDENVRSLYAFIIAHRDELAQPCIDRSLQDGGGVTFAVVAGGESFSFSCWNTTTPSFTALDTRFGALPSEATP